MKKFFWLILLWPCLALASQTVHDDLEFQGYNLENTGAIQSSVSEWYHCHHISALSVAAGGSGATWTVPSGTTIGGYQLDAAGEYLYMNGKV